MFEVCVFHRLTGCFVCPLLFSLYTTPPQSGDCKIYGCQIQLIFMWMTPSCSSIYLLEISFNLLKACLNDIHTWMFENKLQFNPEKKTRLGQLGANISPDRSSLTPQVLIGNFLKHNYPLLYELQHINLLCLYLPKEDGVSPDAEYIPQIIFSIFLQ